MAITRQALREEESFRLRLRVRGSVTGKAAGPPVTMVVQTVGDLIPQSQSPISSFVHKVGDTDWPRVIGYDAATAKLTLNRDKFANADTVDVYSILTPDDWNDSVINVAIPKLFRQERVVVTPIAAQPEYDLTTLASWLTSREQVEEVRYRQTDGGTPAKLLVEEPYPAWEATPSNNVLTLRLHTLPKYLTNVTFVVIGRNHYTKLATDAGSTTMPDLLAKAAVRVEALRLIWTIMGEEQAKGMFGSELAEAMNELAEAKRRHLPRVAPHPLQFPTPYYGPEMAMPDGGWSGW